MAVAKQKTRWGDSVEEVEGDSAVVLPQRQEYGPDESGVKTVVELKHKDNGKPVKETKRVKVSTFTRKVTPSMKARRQWARFGDARNATAEEEKSRTVVSTEEVVLERPHAAKKDEEQRTDQLAALASSNATLLVCRICGKRGDHWTSKCPYRSLAASKGITVGESPDNDSAGGLPSKPSSGGYVPPSQRPGAKVEGESMYKRREDNSIRITNLSEETREDDLEELCRPFGMLQRTFIAYDKETGESRGFAFVTFHRKEDAERAIKKLDGHGYDSLILRVEWFVDR
jgi:translation initiation factor 3 subunit G